MVVVLVIGILLAVGIPTYLGARKRAHDRAAQTDLMSALDTAAVVLIDNGDVGTTDAQLEAIEPSLDFAWQGDVDDGQISWRDGGVNSQEIWFATRSKSGDCFHLRWTISGGNAGVAYASEPNPTSCRIANYTGPLTWSDSW